MNNKGTHSVLQKNVRNPRKINKRSNAKQDEVKLTKYVDGAVFPLQGSFADQL